MIRTFVFDIDGTLANIEHRRHLVEAKPKDWKAFNDAMVHDKPNPDICYLYSTLANVRHQQNVVLCTGRSEEYREITEQWLQYHWITDYKKIYMRKTNDRRGDDIIKVELLQEIRKDFGEPYIWFDDRDRVVNAIRAQGVRVLQVAPGDF